jgi:hypothetical protein
MNPTICPARHALLRAVLPLLAAVLLLGALQHGMPSVLHGVRSLAACGPIYTVAVLRGHLEHDPHGWVGRPLWVQGLAVRSVRLHMPDVGSVVLAQPHLLDPVTLAVSLPLVRASAAPLWAQLRQLPLLDGLLPPPQRVQWGTLARYCIVVRAAGSPETPGGYAAVLLDAA